MCDVSKNIKILLHQRIQYCLFNTQTVCFKPRFSRNFHLPSQSPLLGLTVSHPASQPASQPGPPARIQPRSETPIRVESVPQYARKKVVWECHSRCLLYIH